MRKHLLFIGLATLLLVGCGKKQTVVEESDTSTKPIVVEEVKVEETKKPETTKKETTIAANQNLLTGIEDLSQNAIGKRPVAVMINNVKQALPQYGISAADVIIEMPVEGGLTRLMALYGDYTKVPDVCAIRSCRDYFPVIAKGFDAFYVHWGMGNGMESYVNSLGVDRFDGMSNPGNLFARDQSRRNAGYALEHTGYFKGTEFAAYLKEQDYRLKLDEEKTGTAFRFVAKGSTITPKGEDCATAHVEFGAATADFTYDEETQLYLKDINGNPQMDAKTEEQLAFMNVIILETSVTTRSNGLHKSIDWQGSSDAVGYYISQGKVQEIRWSKKDTDSYLKFYTKKGNELKLNRGKTYIAFTSFDNTSWE